MPRQPRQGSGTGIYHVMLRGINQQDIFEEPGDYWKFIRLLQMQAFPTDKKGDPLPPHCVVYAYCLMSNHVHLLVRETAEGITPPMRSLAISYAQFYNVKYSHSGHLFQDRFKSEAVNDMAYFITLLRYIHQNPVAAGIVREVRQYIWSSWCEYDESMPCAVPVCTTQHVFSRVSATELTELVNTPLSKALRILDFDNETAVRVSDEKVRQFILSTCGAQSISDFQHLSKDVRKDVISKARGYGASIRQLTRLTGVSEGIIRNIK